MASKIKEVAGLNSLEKVDRYHRVNEILSNTDHKYYICNQIQGLSVRELDRALYKILGDCQPSEYELEMMEEREAVPQKFDDVIDFNKALKTVRPSEPTKYRTYSREEVAELMKASETNYDQPNPLENFDPSQYGTYSRLDVFELMKNDGTIPEDATYDGPEDDY